MSEAIKSTGGSSKGYYEVIYLNDQGKERSVECRHIINAKNMNFNIGNIFKAVWRLGSKAGTSVDYDLRKIPFFAIEELRRIGAIKDKRDLENYLSSLVGAKVTIGDDFE